MPDPNGIGKPYPVASSAAQAIAAAQKARADATIEVPVVGWGLALKVAPASPTAYYQAESMAEKIAEQTGKRREEQAESRWAWFRACVVEPKFENQEIWDLQAADPGEFDKVAQVCELLTKRTPWPLFALALWAQHAQGIEALETKGELPAGSSKFWMGLIGAFSAYATGEAEGTASDLAAVGEAIAKADPKMSLDEASELIETHLGSMAGEAKNEPEAGSPSGEPASSTPDEAPAS